MANAAIETCNLTKAFPGGTVALAGLDLAVPQGAVYGLVGRNGSGKTTTLRVLMGLLRADQGTARVLGCDLWQAPRRVRARVAYVSQNQQLHGWMTVGELCRYTSHFYESWDTGYARTLSGRWGLSWGRRVGGLSTGEQRKVAMLLALASRPEVLLLDEPVANLDPIARREIIDEILETITSDLGCTVLFSTHLLGDLERVAEYVGMMDRGRMALSDRLESWQNTLKRVQVIFPNSGTPPGFTVPGALRSWTCGPVVTAIARVAPDFELEMLRNLPGVRVNVFGIGLEELFLELFGEPRDVRAPASPAEPPQPTEDSADKILSIHQTR